MALLNKLTSSIFLLGTGSIGIAGASGFRSSSNELEQGKKEMLREEISSINEFLTIEGKNEKLKDLIERFASTVSGFKDLASVLVNSVLLELIEGNSSDVSILKTKIKNRLDSLKLKAISSLKEEDKNSKYELYGGEEKYKHYHAINGIKEIFIDELIKHLPQLMEKQSDDLQGKNNSDDLIKKYLGDFYDKVLDDYIAHNKPIFVYRWKFEYTEENIKDKLKDIFKDQKVINVPSKAGYLFPYIKDKSKWEEFRKQTNFDKPHEKLIIPLSFIENPNFSSQFIISFLKLHKSNGSTKLETIKFLDEHDQNYEHKDVLETEHGVYFRDKNHIQFLKKQTLDNSSTKKEIIKVFKNSEYTFDIQHELKKWLEKHFDRIFLSIWSKLETNLQDTKEFKTLSEHLEKLLKANILGDSLVKLRKQVTKDYLEVEKAYDPIKNESEKYERNPLLKFSAKFPYEFYKSETSETLKKLNEENLALDELESLFLTKQENKTELNPSYKNEFKENHTSFKSELKKSIEKIKQPELSDKHLYLFDNGQDNKKLSNSEIFNNLWINSIHNGKIKDYLQNKQIYKHLSDNQNENSSWHENLFSENAIKKIIGNENSKYKTEIFKRYLLSKIMNELKNAPHPNIYSQDLLTKILQKNETNSIKTLLNMLKTTYSDKGKDELGDYSKDTFSELLTLKFLSKDTFKNYRKLLKQKFAQSSSYFFVFSKKYKENGICKPNSSSDLKAEIKKSWQLNNNVLFKNAENQAWSPLNCLEREDILSFANINNQNNQELMGGYQGLITEEQFKNLLPEEIFKKIKKFSRWSDAENIKKNIDEISTHASMDEFLNKLKLEFPGINWSFVENKKWINPNWNLESKNINGKNLTLEERKKILIGFLGSKEKPKINGNSSLSHQFKTQLEFKNSSNNKIEDGFLKDFFKRQQGYLKLENEQLISDNQNNKYLIYAVQLKYSDVSNDENWKKFLEEVNFDLLAQNLIEQLSNKDLQKNAIYQLLSLKDNGISKIKIGDKRIQQQMGFEWLN